ncbi:MAG: hypothetical protein RLZZ237_1544 [Pseudomonadota bacterium]|jgi:hypothetical protein
MIHILHDGAGIKAHARLHGTMSAAKCSRVSMIGRYAQRFPGIDFTV